MKKFLNSKYYLGIWLIIVATFNVVLFISVDESYLKINTFWLIYAFIMFALIVIGMLSIMDIKNKTNQNLFVPLITPIAIIIIVLGIVLFFFIEKLLFKPVLVTFIILTAILLVNINLCFYYKGKITTIPIKNFEIIDMSGFCEMLNILEDQTNNEALKRLLELLNTLAIDIHSSTSESARELETRIFEYSGFMKNAVESGNTNQAIYHAQKIQKLLEQRSML